MSRPRAAEWGVAVVVGVAVAAATTTLRFGSGSDADALAQTVDVGRPRTLVVGTPAGARTDRVDGTRRGRAHDMFPTGGLRTDWRLPLGVAIDSGPLVDARGTTVVVGTRGEVVAVARDGTERWRVSTDSPQPGPPALLSDDTVVFADALGEAVAVRAGTVRWRTRFGRADASHPAPLPLDDGGVVVATAHDLALLDAEGHARARATLPEGAVGPLVAAAALGKVVAVGVSGTVWAWTPGASEVTRLGSFASTPDGGAALADDHTLVAVTAGGAHLSAIDLVRGTTTTRAVAPAGLWLGPPAVGDGATVLLLLAPTAELTVSLDATGAEMGRALLTSRIPPLGPDGGTIPLVTLSHTAPLVDSAGTVAFATVEGSLGVVSGTTAELLADGCLAPTGGHPATADPSPSATPNATNSSQPRIAGLAPLGPGAFVAACRAGSLVAVRASEPASPARPPRPAPPTGQPNVPHL